MQTNRTERTVTPERVREWERAAANPALSPNDLKELAARLDDLGFADSPAAARLIANPNTPPEVFAGRIRRHPEAFLANPVVPLLLLEDPTFLSRLTEEDILTLLRLAATPRAMVALAAEYANSEDVSEAARWHIAAPHWRGRGEADPTSDEWQAEIFDALRAMDPGDEDRVWELVELGAVPRRIAQAIGWWPVQEPSPLLPPLHEEGAEQPTPPFAIPEGGWAALASASRETRIRYAADPRTPVEVLWSLFDADKEPIFRALAGNPAAPSELLTRLAKRYSETNRDGDVTLPLAWNPNTPPEALRLLAASRSPETLQALASHPQTPVDALRLLNTHINARTRRLVRRHPTMPREYISPARTTLIRDNGGSEPRVPLTILPLLLVACQENHSDTWFAVQRESLIWQNRLAVALNPHTPLSDLEYMAEKEGHRLVRAAARARRWNPSRTPFPTIFAEMPPPPAPIRKAERPPRTDRNDRERKGKQRR
jgi:hypothetical protein